MGRQPGLKKKRFKVHSAVISDLDLRLLRVMADSEWATATSVSELIRQAVHQFVNREMIHLLNRTKIENKEDELQFYLRTNGIKILREA